MLVNEIAEMQDKFDAVFVSCGNVIIHEAAQRAVKSLLVILTTEKGIAHRTRRIGQRRSARAANMRRDIAAREEAIKIDTVRFEAREINADGMIAGRVRLQRLLDNNS